jgi:geranyl-CoA carboxylase alpha subunit
LRLWQPPVGVRVEHALRSGIEIAPFYDSMIAKVIAHGHDRESARRRLAGALESLVALGVPTNREHLLRCLADPVFAEGAATTAFLTEQAEALDASDPEADRRLIWLAALVLFLSAAADVADDTGAVRSHPLAHRLPLPMRLSSAGGETPATVTRVSACLIDVSIDGTLQRYEVLEQGATALRFAADGLQQRATFVREGNRLWLQHEGRTIEVEDRTRAAARSGPAAAGDGQLRASMAGRVVAVLARVGDPVEAGQPLLTLEAMKMEHVHNAPRSGVITALHAVAGEQVAAGNVVAVIQ